MGRCKGRPQFPWGMMLCVMFNPAAPAAAGALTAAGRGATAQEERRSPSRTRARNPNVRSFTVTISAVARGKWLNAARRESCRNIRHSGSGIVSVFKGTRPPECSQFVNRCVDPWATVGPLLSRVTSPRILRTISLNGQKWILKTRVHGKPNQRERRIKWHRKKPRKWSKSATWSRQKTPKAAVGAAVVASPITGFNKEWPLESRTVVPSHGAIVYPFCIFSVRDGGSLNLRVHLRVCGTCTGANTKQRATYEY